MSDTPETDLWLKQQIVCNYEHEMVSAGFARTLERERNEARAERDEWIARFRADEQLIKEAMEKHE